jgi:uncharacterized repeat protein (TIGR02543 family)
MAAGKDYPQLRNMPSLDIEIPIIDIPVKDTYTITYNANGGTGAPAPQIKIHDIPLKLSEVKPLRPGYTFIGWTTNINSILSRYQPGGTYTANASAMLLAEWQLTPPVTVIITLMSLDPNLYIASLPKVSGTQIGLLPTPPRDGYNFMGWYTGPNGTGTKITPETIVPPTNVTYYAHWTEIIKRTDYILYFDEPYGYYIANDGWAPVEISAYVMDGKGTPITAAELLSIVYTAESGVKNTTGLFTLEDLNLGNEDDYLCNTTVTAVAALKNGTVLRETVDVYMLFIPPR